MPSRDEPQVSIFVPAFNAGRYVAQTLDSILAQTWRDFELVVLDDASTDDTAEVVRRFEHDPRVRYVRNERNLGQFRTMSRALELTRAPLVAIYHSDDVYEPTIVEEEVGFLRRHPAAGAVFAQDNIIDEHDRLVARVRLPRELRGREVFGYDEVYRYLLRHKNQILCCPTFMVRREVLEEVGPFDHARYRIAGDLDMWIRLLRRRPVGILDRRLVNYRKSGTQESAKYRRLRVTEEEFFEIMDRYGELDGWAARTTPDERREYAFHRLDDFTFRAANLVILGRPDEAWPLLASRFTWFSLLRHPRRRKLRVLLLRTLMRTMLRARQARRLRNVLLRSEYGLPGDTDVATGPVQREPR